LELQDEIISTILLLLSRIYVNKRSVYGKLALQEKTAMNDQEKRQWLETVCKQLEKNAVLKQNTYTVLVLIALSKQGLHQKASSITSETVARFITELKVQDSAEYSSNLVDFDIDVYFMLVLNQLLRFDTSARDLLLRDFNMFQRRHNIRFMRLLYSQLSGQGKNGFVD
jgi:hypothetical protein